MIKKENLGKIIIWSGALLIVASLTLFIFVFYSVILEEIRYIFSNKNIDKNIIVLDKEFENKDTSIIPADSGFSIIIPKIDVNAPVVKNVDPLSEYEYRNKLANGVAHAQETKLPGEIGNTFLFAHSSNDFYVESEYNTIFYLLNKLEKNDKFFIVYEDDIYEYLISEIRKVDPENVEYLKAVSEESTATLMTCWPPGIAAKRLIVIGFLEEVSKNGEMVIEK